MNAAEVPTRSMPADRATDAHGRLRSLLLSGELVVGDELKEVDLAERLAMSRTPVREALHRLDVEGVVVRRGRTYVVAGLDAAEEANIAQVRHVLEPLAAEAAASAVQAGLIAPVEISALAEAVGDLRSAAATGDGAAAAIANHDFHVRLATMGRNDVLAEAIMRLTDRLAIATFQRLGSTSWAAEAAAQHGRIADAVAAGDAAAARVATEEHIARVAAE